MPSNGGYSITTYNPHPDSWTYESNLRTAIAAEQAGFDFLFPVARWKGFGGPSKFMGAGLETMTWAAGLLSRTSRIRVFSTVHVPMYHPAIVAKAGATLDQIGGGRWGVNLVSGWSAAEFNMLGVELLPHEDRYARTTDFIKCLKGFWSEPPGEFNFESQYYTIRGGYSCPQPAVMPPIANAGNSDAGVDLAASACDWAFTGPATVSDAPATVERVRARAAAHLRDIRVMCTVMPVWADTAEEAQAEVDKIIENVDREAAYNWAADMIGIDKFGKAGPPYDKLAVGSGALYFVGTPEMIADQFSELYAAGVDGLMLIFHDYEKDIDRFDQQIRPLLRARGLL